TPSGLPSISFIKVSLWSLFLSPLKLNHYGWAGFAVWEAVLSYSLERLTEPHRPEHCSAIHQCSAPPEPRKSAQERSVPPRPSVNGMVRNMGKERGVPQWSPKS